MHTAKAARGRGVGRAIVEHLLGGRRRARGRPRQPRDGTMEAFGPARSLYASVGFVPCGPFGDYRESPDNTFMTLVLDDRAADPPG